MVEPAGPGSLVLLILLYIGTAFIGIQKSGNDHTLIIKVTELNRIRKCVDLVTDKVTD